MQRLCILALVASGLFASAAGAAEPGWWGRVVAPEPIRSQIKSTPIIYRPYRPFHFYGNTIRRKYYRGIGIVAPRDIVHAAGALVANR